MSLSGVDSIGSFTVVNEEIKCRFPDGGRVCDTGKGCHHSLEALYTVV